MEMFILNIETDIFNFEMHVSGLEIKGDRWFSAF